MLSSRPGSPVRSRHCFRIHGFPIRSCCAIVDLKKGGLTNERKMEPEASLKESALPYL
ncbi:unnamed protein product [Spirodela intermedia]|uniref:Uncharacterized protein n=1 Tax=Spirodela intermedia TaxID=51605 RepID=A0ABN7E8W9_SPIIN|nr:unnamed protein product [Spirodela intermedia]